MQKKGSKLSGDPLRREMAAHCILYQNPMDRVDPGGLQTMYCKEDMSRK